MPGLNLGWWSGVTAALPARWEKPKGGKAPAAQSRSSLSRKENTAPKNYDCDENDCAPFAPGSPTRPTGVRARFQSEAAAGVPFAAATPAAAGTSMAIAGRGGNDEGARHDAL